MFFIPGNLILLRLIYRFHQTEHIVTAVLMTIVLTTVLTWFAKVAVQMNVDFMVYSRKVFIVFVGLFVVAIKLLVVQNPMIQTVYAVLSALLYCLVSLSDCKLISG